MSHSFLIRLAAATAAATLLSLSAACSDPGSAPTGLTPTAPTHAAGIVSRTIIGDTVTTVFVVSNQNTQAYTADIGHASKISFPYAASSICDPATSSYGVGTWDEPCDAATQSITITAKSWLNAEGRLATDFQPALRFRPGLKNGVTLYLKDATLANEHIDHCTAAACVDEALVDPTVATRFDLKNGFAYRMVKHFSGYTVTADRSGGAMMY